MKKGIAIIALIATVLPSSALAIPNDVSANEWYFDTVNSFVQEGYIDDNQPFRPTHNATRGELVELIVAMLGGSIHAPYSGQSFDDVPTSSALFPAFEEAGVSGWLKGKDNCYGSHPCTASPNAPINRAEASAMIIRAFGLNDSNEAPEFTDNAPSEWYHGVIKTAASLCILRGDAGKPHVRPANSMIRAEMVVMLDRSRQKLTFPNCTQAKAAVIPQKTVSSSSSSSLIKSSSSSLPVNRPDEWAKSLRELAISSQENFDSGIEASKTLPRDSALQLLEALNAYNHFLSAISYAADLAEIRQLTKEEKLLVNQAMKGLGDSLAEMSKAIAKGMEQRSTVPTLSPQPTYIAPVQTQPSVDCNAERRKANSLGIQNTSSWSWYMVSIGCTTLESHCSWMQKIGANDSRCTAN